MLRLVGCGLTALAAGVLWTSSAVADGVVYRARGCGDYLIVSTQTGYSVVAGSAVSGVKEQDQLIGNLEQPGHVSAFDRTAGHSVFGVVEDARLSRAEADRRVAVHCQTPFTEKIVAGNVSRVCGNTIFVNTMNGYAVLERISGGVVAVNDEVSGNFDRTGNATVRDKQANSTLNVFVQDMRLPKSAVDRTMSAFCRPRAGSG